MERRRDSARRPREHGVDGKPRGDLRGCDAAARGRDEHLAPVAARGERRAQGGQVAADERADVGVEHGRAEALVLPELGQDLLGGADEPAGQPLAREARRRPLVERVRVAVQEADHGGARSAAIGGRRDPGRGLDHVGRLERTQHRAVEGHPLVHFQHALPGHERGGLERPDVVEDRPVRARDLQRVAEPPGRDDPDRGTLALEDGVGPDGGPVHEPLRRRQRDLELGERVQEALRGVTGIRRRFPHPEDLRRLIVDHDVGEGATHVHADPEHAPPPTLEPRASLRVAGSMLAEHGIDEPRWSRCRNGNGSRLGRHPAGVNRGQPGASLLMRDSAGYNPARHEKRTHGALPERC